MTPASPSKLGAVSDALAGFLAPLVGRPVYFEPLSGNNGDRLIEMGSRHVLTQHGIAFAATPAEADAIVINGGAGMTDLWQAGLDVLGRYARIHPDKPLAVLPTTFSLAPAKLASILAPRRGPTLLLGRERFSLDVLNAAELGPRVKIGIDHDMAFRLADSEFFTALWGRRSQRHILVVERGDAESATGLRERALGPAIVRSAWRRVVPRAVSRCVKRHVVNRAYRDSPFVADSVRRVRDDRPSLAATRVIAADISRPDLYQFDAFADLVATAAAVVTTRLHVGILSAMLRKPTYLRTTGAPYRKIQGIYEYSLSGQPHVQLL